MSEQSFITTTTGQSKVDSEDQRSMNRSPGRRPHATTPSSKVISNKKTEAPGGENSARKRPSIVSKGSTDSGVKKHNTKAEKENESKYPPLRFSPDKTSKVKLPLGITAGQSNVKRDSGQSRVQGIDKSPQRNDIYAWRSSVTRKKVRVSSRPQSIQAYRPSRIPIATRPETPELQQDIYKDVDDCPVTPAGQVESEQRFFVSDVGSVSSQFSDEVEAPETEPEEQMLQPTLYGEAEKISDLRNQFLQALGIQEISLPSLTDYIQNVNFNTVLKDRLREIKIQEMRQRISVVKILHYSSKYHGANENELGCVKGWLDDLNEELWMIECEKMQASKVWFDQIFRWLWYRPGSDDSDTTQYDAAPKDELYVLYNMEPLRVLAAKKEHELFNLRDTGVELLRNGFRNKERKMLEYWGKLRGLFNIPTSCGEDIIGVYMRKLTRWDGVELPESTIQRRRMWYL